MIFNSVTYLVFLAIAVSLFWVLPSRPRIWVVFLAGLTFYGFWRPEFLAVILLSTVVDYVASLRIEASTDKRVRALWLVLSLVVNLGLLFYFKYLYFVVDNAVFVLQWFGLAIQSPALNIVLPLGISFYTFQTISYTVDVYRGNYHAERDFILYGCYVTFFPQLVAGPILRAGELMYQFSARPVFRWEHLVIGFRRILFGLFLKVVLADNLAPLVDSGFSINIRDLSALDVVTLAFLFGFQIYFDFSAYSHIALGSARLMGIEFPENFNFPYLATSPRDFWRRWHISLSSWIRDYLYLPLIGLTVGRRSLGGLAVATDPGDSSRRTPALFLTWAIMGLWHGANWTFVLWGLYHASMIFAYRLLAGRIHSVRPVLQIWGGRLITLPLMMLGWVFFRANSAGDAIAMYTKLFSPEQWTYLGMRENTYLVAAITLLAAYITYFVHANADRAFNDRGLLIRFSCETLVTGVAAALVFVFLRPIRQFIYFQF